MLQLKGHCTVPMYRLLQRESRDGGHWILSCGNIFLFPPVQVSSVVKQKKKKDFIFEKNVASDCM